MGNWYGCTSVYNLYINLVYILHVLNSVCVCVYTSICASTDPKSGAQIEMAKLPVQKVREKKKDCRCTEPDKLIKMCLIVGVSGGLSWLSI